MARVVPDPLAERPVMRVVLGVVLAGAWLSGCGEDCQTACAKVYDPAQCAVVVPGEDPDLLRKECISECQAALTQPGGMEGYNPYEKITDPAWENHVLKNEVQAAEWMNCVAEQECDNLQLQTGGICWPIP